MGPSYCGRGLYCAITVFGYPLILTLSILSDKTAVRGIRGGGTKYPPSFSQHMNIVKISLRSLFLVRL